VKKILLTDVTMRDGLQMQTHVMDVGAKLELFEALWALNFERYEITSFVNPKWVPQFQNSDEFLGVLLKKHSIDPAKLMGFVPNTKGLDRLLAYPIGWVSSFVALSETFHKKNVNQSIQETIDDLAVMIAKAHAAKRKVRVYLSTVFGCPYEGVIAEFQRDQVFEAVARLKPDEIALSDTIGVAIPLEIAGALKALSQYHPQEATALHLHNTYGLGLAGVHQAITLGVDKIDGATGGIGGCPYAKGASGNLATEEVVYARARLEGGEFPVKAFEKVWSLLKAQGVPMTSHLAEIWDKGAEPWQSTNY